MRVAMVSTPHIPTPPKGYGASELIAGQLAEGLVRRGHEVRLFAAAGSSPRVQERRTYAQVWRGRTFDQRETIHVAYSLREVADCDVVHNHCVTAGPPFARLMARPFLTTLHYLHPLVHAFPDGDYVAVSQSQRSAIARAFPETNVVATIYNGVDLDELPLADHRDDYLLFLGRFHPNKGADLAVALAERLDRRLVIAAPAPPDDQRAWFEETIRPHLRGKITWVGPVEGEVKARLLGSAAATLLPLRWDEPFGLVIAESMACGTPPIALRRGAAPELIVDGVTGFLVDDLDAMAAAVDRVATIEPVACRQHVADHFSIDRMVDSYLNLYTAYLTRS